MWLISRCKRGDLVSLKFRFYGARCGETFGSGVYEYSPVKERKRNEQKTATVKLEKPQRTSSARARRSFPVFSRPRIAAVVCLRVYVHTHALLLPSKPRVETPNPYGYYGRRLSIRSAVVFSPFTRTQDTDEHADMKYLTLNSGGKMPVVGYGTWQVSVVTKYVFDENTCVLMLMSLRVSL